MQKEMVARGRAGEDKEGEMVERELASREGNGGKGKVKGMQGGLVALGGGGWETNGREGGQGEH